MKTYLLIKILICGALMTAGTGISNLVKGQSDTQIRVMSYNIRYDNPDDGINRWDNRKQRVGNLILFHRPDVIGLQEALLNQINWLENHLQDYEWIGVGRADGKNEGEFSPIFYNAERLEALEHNTFWLSSTPEKPSTGWDAALPRIVTWAHFRDRSTGEEFYAFNTHFDHRGEAARAESASLIINKIEGMAGEDIPVVLTGDFNAQPDSEPYSILTGALSDAFHATRLPHYGPEATYLDEDGGFSVSSGQGGRRIDYIFTNELTTVLRHGILSTFRDGRFPSDHLPVMADIAL